MTDKTFDVTTEQTTHFDCRDIEDLIRSRNDKKDFTPTLRIWDNENNCWLESSVRMDWYVIGIQVEK